MGTVTRGQEPEALSGPAVPSCAKEVQSLYEANVATNKGNADLLVLPGLVANRKARTVEVQAESTGLKPKELVEFLLVGHESGKGYEALLWAYAKPGDIHRALSFIGLKPGPPRNPLFPHLSRGGDRVTVTVREKDGDTYPIERLVYDTTTKKTLPEEGFLFSGSLRIPPGRKGEGGLVSDQDELRSVASLYTEPTAVLDVPRQVIQSDVYGQLVVNAARVLGKGALQTIIMAPAPSDGRPPAKNLSLLFYASKGTNSVGCRLSEKEKVLCESAPVSSVFEQLGAFKKEAGASSLHLAFGNEVSLSDISKAAKLMTMLEMMEVVVVEPPVPGELYYRAFAPNNAWRTPEGRHAQPWELHLNRSQEKVQGVLVWHEPVYGEDGSRQSFKRHETQVPDGLAAKRHLSMDAEKRKSAFQPALPRVLLVYAKDDLNYGDLMTFIKPVLETHGTVYCFL